MTTSIDTESLRQKVREGYGKIAQGGGSCGGPAQGCCGAPATGPDSLAAHIGYSSEELATLPEGANLGLSCGNPNALAALQPGEVVLDLGAGGGFDVFIAGPKVGPAGRAIGVDMTPEMLARARQNIAAYRARTRLDNVEFRLGEIEHLPVADASVDAAISNCVLNLSPDKPQCWREIARVLKPGGRVAVSDLALLQPLPPAVASMVEALVGCVAGAVTVAETERMAREAGLVDIQLKAKPGYVDGMVDGQDPLYAKILAHLPAGAKPGDYVTSLEITARKPAADLRANAARAARQPTASVAVYDPPMCCSTGVCGPEVDPALVRFAADLKFLQDQGVEVRRFGLAQNPAAFVENDLVRDALTKTGEAALPIVLVGAAVVANGRYPSREELTASLGLAAPTPSLFTPAVAELVAIGTAIAANCEPCLRYHVHEAEKLGVPLADTARAIALAVKVKDAPHRNIMRLADRLTRNETTAAGPAPSAGATVAAAQDNASKSPCCS